MLSVKGAVAALMVIALGIAVMKIPGTMINGGDIARNRNRDSGKTTHIIGTLQRDAIESSTDGVEDSGEDWHVESHASADLSPVYDDQTDGVDSSIFGSNTRVKSKSLDPENLDSCSEPGSIRQRYRESCKELVSVYKSIVNIHNEVHKSWERRRSVSKRKSLQDACDALQSVSNALYSYLDGHITTDIVAVHPIADKDKNKDVANDIICTKCMMGDDRGDNDKDQNGTEDENSNGSNNNNSDACMAQIDAGAASRACNAIIKIHHLVSQAVELMESNHYLKTKYKGGVDVLRVLYQANHDLKGIFVELDCHWCFSKELSSL